MSDQTHPQVLQWSATVLSLIDLMLVGAGVARYPAVLDGGTMIVGSVIVLMLVYVTGGIAVVRWLAPKQLVSVGQANLYGLLCGLWMMLLLSIELFTDWLSYLPRSPISLAPFGVMLGLFALAGYRGVQKISTPGTGVATAILSAIVGGLILVAYGLAVDLAAHAWLEHVLLAEFQQSGMPDLSAYVLFNTLDGASSHLFLMPILGLVFGVAGEIAARMRHEMIRERTG